MDYRNYSYFKPYSDECYKEKNECKEQKDYRQQKGCKDQKDYDDHKDCNDHKDYKEYKGQKDCKEQKEYKDSCHCDDEQRHVHELLGSVLIAGCKTPHNHRFATVTGEAIPCGPHDHVHEVVFRTDFYDEHYHEFKGRTGGAIQVGDRHVHFIESVTSIDDSHRHEFRAATLINDPIGKIDKCKKYDNKGDYKEEYKEDYKEDYSYREGYVK